MSKKYIGMVNVRMLWNVSVVSLIGKFVFVCAVPLFLMGLSHSVLASDMTEGKQINVVFRFDDYMQGSRPRIEQAVIDLFRKHHVPLTVGIVPFHNDLPLSADKIAFIKSALENHSVEVALHGYDHSQYGNRRSEFVGMNYEAQFGRIKKGKSYLEAKLGIALNAFIPPFNTYDAATLDVIEKLGFTILSDDRLGIVRPGRNLRYIPTTCQLRDFRAALAEARKPYFKDPIIVIMFHEYDFIADGLNRGFLKLENVEMLLRWLAKQPDISLVSFSDLADGKNDLGATRYSANDKYWHLMQVAKKLVHPSLLADLPHHIYLTRYEAWFALVILVGIVGIFSLIILGVAIVMGRFAMKRVSLLRDLLALPVTHVCAVICIALLIYFVLRNGEAGFIGYGTIVCAIGFYLGLFYMQDRSGISATQFTLDCSGRKMRWGA